MGDGELRLPQLAAIRMTYDPSLLGEYYESGALYFVYYNGTDWELIKADTAPEIQVMSFQTRHFFLFGKAELPLGERIEQFTANQALGEWAKKQSSLFPAH